MSGYVLVGRDIEGRTEPKPIGVAYLNDDDVRAVTGMFSPKKGIRIRGIDETDFDTLKAIDVPVWTCRQILGADPEPEGDSLPRKDEYPAGSIVSYESPLFGELRAQVIEDNGACVWIWHPLRECEANIPRNWIMGDKVTGP